MKTVSEIVQELLDKKVINTEDAMVLLKMEAEKKMVVYPTYPTPNQPYWYYDQWSQPYYDSGTNTPHPDTYTITC